MRLTFPLALVLALVANLVPTFGKVPNQQPASNDPSPPQPTK
ncbi:MAG TPA: hypothetical protein VE085_15300 [Burkholderiales bacterium]|nr:hypothetical protein [Burkholderiales bacterium]